MIRLPAVLVILAVPVQAVVTELWDHRYNGPANGNDYATALAVDRSGNVVVTGWSQTFCCYDFYTAKYASADGALLWEKRYHGDGNSGAAALLLDASGNVVVTGRSYPDYYTAKYEAADGALLWEIRSNGLGGTPTAMAMDASGNVVVSGYSEPLSEDYYTAKYAALDGRLLWEQRYNGPGNEDDEANAVAVDGSGNVVVTGYSTDTNGYSGLYMAKYAAADGTLLWEKRSSSATNSALEGRALAVDAGGNVVVTGNSHNGTNYDYYTGKYAGADGTLLWEKRYNGPANGDDFALAVAVDSSGNAVVTGRSGYSLYTAKYAAGNGGLLWENRENNPDEGAAILVDGNGDVVVTGSSDDGYYTAKYAGANGALVWENYYQGSLSPYVHAVGLALGPNGMVAVTGYFEAVYGSHNYDYGTVVYRENLPAISLDKVPTGVRLRFPGGAGHTYQVLRAPAIAGLWSTNATLTAVTNGLIEYMDTNALSGSAFYRTAAAP